MAGLQRCEASSDFVAVAECSVCAEVGVVDFVACFGELVGEALDLGRMACFVAGASGVVGEVAVGVAVHGW